MKNSVIICGYPKSGNTWLTRLTAEILNCPVTGFWGDPSNKEQAIEGTDRKSDSQCFKAHHKIDRLLRSPDFGGKGLEKLIYIYRDPRAVSVSASHHFLIPKYPRIHSLLNALPKGTGIYRKFVHRRAHSLDPIVRGMIHGTSKGAWLNEPWMKHVEGYIHRPDVLSLSYEALRKDPLMATRQITEFLSIKRSDAELKEAIDAQSFARKKKKLESKGEVGRATLIRKGETDAWKEELPAHHVQYIEQNVGVLMTELGYQLVSGS